MQQLDDEWAQFQTQVNSNNPLVYEALTTKKINTQDIPKPSDIYISTQTKIAHLNSTIELYDIFWKLKVQEYFLQQEGIIKKSIKVNCNTPEEVVELEEHIRKEKTIDIQILSQVDNPNARKTKFKDVRKIEVGLSKKDLTTYRKKKKGAFYNCFALIIRVYYKLQWKEVHVKIFNTGKLEIPGIQFDDLLTITLDKLICILKPLVGDTIDYHRNDVSTVLINSNFSCKFFVDRFKLYDILKTTYNISAAYDPCSYPGIQCKFYYNKFNKEHNGYKPSIDDGGDNEEYTNAWQGISFMIFRTGSVLIVGNCNRDVINIIYLFLKKLLVAEHPNIFIKNNINKKKKSVKKVKKKNILFTIK
jgi:TATA-box binding protein (TBP) (component of TFIID and TFIIIB)